MDDKYGKPRMGMLLISPPRFRNLGAGTEHGQYYVRKNIEAERIVNKASAFADVIYNGIVYERDDVKAAMKSFYNADVDLVFACFMSWADDFAWIRFLRDMYNIPIIFAFIVRDKLGFEDSISEDDFIEFLSAGSLVGSLEASGSIKRFQRPMFHIVTGTLDNVMEETKAYSYVSKLRSILKTSVFGLLPSYNEVMWSTYVDPYNFFMKAGPELRFLSVCSLEEECESIRKEEIEKVLKEIMSRYQIDESVDIDKLTVSVQASLALESLARKNNIDMLVLNDIDPVLLRRIGLRPGFTPCPGTKDIMVVPEGDLGCALACYSLKVLSREHVNFIEPFHIDKINGVFAAGHAGPNDYTDPKGRVKISRDVRFEKSGYKHAGAPFAWYLIPPGEKTMVHISECNGQFKLACGVVDALYSEQHFLAGYSHGIFKSRIPVEEFFHKLIEFGVTQHYALVPGDYTKEMELFAHLMNFDFLKI